MGSGKASDGNRDYRTAVYINPVVLEFGAASAGGVDCHGAFSEGVVGVQYMIPELDEYKTIRKSVEVSIRVKGSRFLGRAFPVVDAVEFKNVLLQHRKEYHDATHHCWGYRVISGDRIEDASSDAGEPSGTAGKPILSVVSGRDLCNVGVIVTRYFGGTKLGTGGLVRAYGECAGATLDRAQVITKVIRDLLVCCFPYDLMNTVMRIMDRHQGTVSDSDYAQDAKVTFTVPRSKIELMKADLFDACRGKIEFFDK